MTINGRAEKAGVSPLALLGGSSGSAGISSLAPATSAPGSQAGQASGTSPLNVQGLVEGILGAQVRKAEVNKLEAEADEANARAENLRSQTFGQQLENEFNTLTKDVRVRILELKADGLDLTNEQQSFNNSVMQIRFAREGEAHYSAIQKASAEMFKIYSAEDRTDKLADSTIRMNARQMILMSAQTRLANSNADVADATVKKVEAETITEGARYLLALSEKEYKDMATKMGFEQILY